MTLIMVEREALVKRGKKRARREKEQGKRSQKSAQEKQRSLAKREGERLRRGDPRQVASSVCSVFFASSLSLSLALLVVLAARLICNL